MFTKAKKDNVRTFGFFADFGKTFLMYTSCITMNIDESPFLLQEKYLKFFKELPKIIDVHFRQNSRQINVYFNIGNYAVLLVNCNNRLS